MELNLAELKKKRVVNVCDGKELGRVCDISFNYPSGEVVGFIVSGKRGLLGGDKSLIKLACVVKIGKDAVLVDVSQPKKEESFESVDYEDE